MAAAKTTKQQRGNPFKPGQSGNPNGRPQGSRNKVSLACEELLSGEADNLTRKCIELAKGGDMQALRLCMERLCPPRKDSPISFELPRMETSTDAVSVLSGLLDEVASGNITPSEAQAVAGIVDTYRRTIETSELDARIKELENYKS